MKLIEDMRISTGLPPSHLMSMLMHAAGRMRRVRARAGGRRQESSPTMIRREETEQRCEAQLEGGIQFRGCQSS